MLTGVWLPLITPFKDGAIDLVSYRRLIDHGIAAGVSGLVPLGTTGEAPTLDEDEAEQIIAETLSHVAGRVPVLFGIGGNATAKVIKTIRRAEAYGDFSILSVCPYYNRPSQEGLYDHFAALSEATARDIVIYNIPYRTGVNLRNETLLRLAERRNIVGVKDSCGEIAQSLDLLATKPADFSVLTGEDALFFTSICSGAEGGILAASHIATDRFVAIARLVAANDLIAARELWQPLQRFIPTLFAEANPMPLKYCLWRQGLIASPECRLPLTQVSPGLRATLDRMLPALA